MSFAPSKYQTAILEFITNGKGSAIVEAVAGSGKTTTVMQCLQRIPANQSVLLLAFNKSIATELGERAPAHVQVKTFHALGLNILTKKLGRCQIDSGKLNKVIKSVITDEDDYRTLNTVVNQLVSKARAIGLMPDGIDGHGLLADTESNWADMMEHFGIDADVDDLSIVLQYAREVIRTSIKMALNDLVIDFDEMIYLHVFFGWAGWRNDWVFVDEAQDVSPVRIALLKLVIKSNGRMVAVGDSRQAIYGFTGADAKSMQTLQADFKAIKLPLSISYRCAQSVVREAQKTMPTIEASSTAPEGSVTSPKDVTVEAFQKGDMIICRKNAPIVGLAFRLISKGIPARIMGRDIAGGLIVLIQKQKAKSLPNLVEKLDKWKAKEIAKWEKLDRPDMVETINDKFNCIHAVMDRSGVSSVDKLVSAIDTMFDKASEETAKANNSVVTLCSIHKSKGLESDTVWFLDNEIIPLKSARKDWQLEQESNLRYVGVTRAKTALKYISSEAIK